MSDGRLNHRLNLFGPPPAPFEIAASIVPLVCQICGCLVEGTTLATSAHHEWHARITLLTMRGGHA